jgi:asparagine synthase (glutamine-hydrolysing)
MCGIAGFLGFPAAVTPAETLRAMTDAIAHRGPDADGAWLDDAAQVALGHRRLSIIDISPLGAQPMVSAAGRFVIVYNGEVYNFASIRDELSAAGAVFRGHSDTEVLLAAFERWGVRASLPRFAGMFAMAVWDREDACLTLVRDRLGEKPLFFGRVGGAWTFASELKALRKFPGWTGETDVRAVTQLLRHAYIQAPLSIYAGIEKLRPGTLVELRAGQEPVHATYWSAAAAARAGLSEPIGGSADEIATALEQVLRPVVRDEMVSDVPLGAFLSGGVDSSLIVALMQAESRTPVRTFTIGFSDTAFNEAGYARAVAAHLGTNHTELFLSGGDALALVDSLPQVYDEPLADSSQLPTMLVSRLTRQHVTVALSGDGGDELFGGYSWHQRRGSTDSVAMRTPALLRRSLGYVLSRIPDPPPAALARVLAGGAHGTGRRPANTLTRLGDMLSTGSESASFDAAMAHSLRPSSLLAMRHRAHAGSGSLSGPWLSESQVFESRMLMDAVSWLPDDILAKVDRAAMAYSLETRAPLLDHRVFEFAWRLHRADKISPAHGKIPLRTLLYRFVPQELIDRPKSGFSIPLASWLRSELRPWAEELIAEPHVRATGMLDAERVSMLWQQHQRGDCDHGSLLWSILSLLAFLRAQHR